MPHPVSIRAAAATSRVPATMQRNFARARYAPCRAGSGSLHRAAPGIRSLTPPDLVLSTCSRHHLAVPAPQTSSSGRQPPFTENCCVEAGGQTDKQRSMSSLRTRKDFLKMMRS